MDEYDDIQKIADQLTENVDVNNGLKDGLSVLDAPIHRKRTPYDYEDEPAPKFVSATPPPPSEYTQRAKSTLLESGKYKVVPVGRPRPAPAPAASAPPPTPPAMFGMGSRKIEI